MAQHILSEVGAKGKVGGSLHWVVKVSGGSPTLHCQEVLGDLRLTPEEKQAR